MADFSKNSGNSTKGVEMIAVIRDGHVAEKDGKVTAQYVDFMVNNSALKKADVEAGKGQERPNLLNQVKKYVNKEGNEKTGFNHEIRMTEGQVAAIKEAGKGKSLEKEGVTYVPFKADVMPLMETVKDADGKAVTNEKGEAKKKLIGFIPNTKTIEPTELGNLTQKRLDKHFENTHAIAEVKTKQRAAQKAAEKAADKVAEAEAPAVSAEMDPDYPL